MRHPATPIHEIDSVDADSAWKWQLANRVTTREQLERYVALTERERWALEDCGQLAVAITPYYAALLGKASLRRTVLPSGDESRLGPGELKDPLGEEKHRVTPNLIHTYPDKVLFLVTSFCPVYCRYCTRSRLVGRSLDPVEEKSQGRSYEDSFRYIEEHTCIRDVLISGGDPLTLSDPQLDHLLGRLRSIPHVRTVRIGSKVPAVLPMRITDALCAILRKHRIWLSLHFIHAAELSPETRGACRMLSDHGIAAVSQTVLLKGINNDLQTLTDLFYGLLEINVKPYYLLQCDPVQGSARFRTSIKEGIELIRSLHGSVSGLAVPQYVVDAPGGGGKIPILSHDQIRRDGDDIIIVNHEGRAYRYPDPE